MYVRRSYSASQKPFRSQDVKAYNFSKPMTIQTFVRYPENLVLYQDTIP